MFKINGFVQPAFSKYLWRSLRTLVRDQQSWVFSEQQMFASPDAVTFWSEHSERNWLNSVLAALEVPREQRLLRSLASYDFQ